jgi:hypothetical protein
MSCTPVPSTTLYGTTELSFSTSVWTSTTSYVPQAPITAFGSTLLPICDARTCTTSTSYGLITSTPAPSPTVVDSLVTWTTVTSVIPMSTRYYPCPSTSDAIPKPGPTREEPKESISPKETTVSTFSKSKRRNQHLSLHRLPRRVRSRSRRVVWRKERSPPHHLNRQ